MGPFKRQNKDKMKSNAKQVQDEQPQLYTTDATPQQDLSNITKNTNIADLPRDDILSEAPAATEETSSEKFTSSSENDIQGFVEEWIRIIRSSTSRVFLMSKKESARLLYNVADAYNISIEESRFIAVLSSAYVNTKSESTRVSNAALDVISNVYGVSKVESFRLLNSVAQSYNISTDDVHAIKYLSEAYDMSGNFLSGLYNISKEESIRLLTHAAETYNIATENATAMICLSKAYNISKTESSNLFDAVVRAYNNSKGSKTNGSSFRTLSRTDPSLSSDSFYGIAAIALILFILKWVRKWVREKLIARRRKVQFGGDNGDDQLGNMEGMQILRSTRDRSSTYDFFGMHLNQARGLSGSFEDHSRGSRGRSSSAETFGPPQIKRERLGSMDIFYSKAKMKKTKPRLTTQTSVSTSSPRATLAPQEFVRSQLIFDENEEEGFLYDEFGLVTLSFEVVHYGPSKKFLTYSALAPPHARAEASRRILPTEIRMRLKRKILLDVSEASVVVQEPASDGRWDYQLATKGVSLHIVPPAAGGVMNLFVKGSPKESWKEFTFDSSQTAAQFQLDLLAYQVLGQTLRNMFEVLCIVHQGSIASNGQEFVLHQSRIVEEKEEKEDSDSPNHNGGCVAWDDAMRALSSIPTIRIALERLWLSHRRPARVEFDSKNKPKTIPEGEINESGYIKDDYLQKRVLLGPVDFFRLFVPALPETAMPQSESNVLRMEQLLSWRKRAARAAVLVRAYADSRRIVNQGWDLHQELVEDDGAITKRLSYDDNEDNNRRDSKAKHEYYEASVSRDVLCHVRPFDFFSKEETPSGNGPERSLVLSPYQAYSLVGMHVFKLPEGRRSSEHPLNMERDPVDIFPSLEEMISGHPDLDFFVMSSFNKSRRRLFVLCYVRSLPKGIDPQFDNVMERYIQGSKEVRDRKAHLMIQLGQRSNLSYGGWMALRALAWHLSFKRGMGSPLGLEATKDRCPLPSMRMAEYVETNHFGGALQKNPDLPTNYVSMTATFESSWISRILFSLLEDRFHARAMDFTLMLEGEQDDELPERALCTTRFVNVDSQAVAQVPSSYDIKEEKKDELTCENTEAGFRRWARHSLHNCLAMFSPPGDADESKHDIQDLRHIRSAGSHLPRINSDYPLEIATNDVIDVLRDLDIPITKGKEKKQCASDIRRTINGDAYDQDMATIPVLSYFDRNDIKRFLRATEGDVKRAALRIVETASWRGQTFPVDLRPCRIELQNGQFFQQGSDLRGNPVFYLRNLCLGPWREDVDASIAAMFYRLDKSLSDVSAEIPDSRITLVILMGRPVEPGDFADNSEEYIDRESEESEEEDSVDSVDERADGEEETETLDDVMPQSEVNPRVSPSETWQVHTNKDLLRRFFELFSTHYPGRLGAVLVVAGKGRNNYYSTNIRRKSAMKKLIRSKVIRRKVIFIDTFAELTMHVDRRNLITIVGGSTPIEGRAFEC